MEKAHWQDWIALVIGFWLVATPWILGAQEHAVTLNFLAVGLAVALLAASEFSVFQAWKEWALAGLGTWLVLAPRLMSFQNDELTWNAAACGGLIIALAGWAIGDTHDILPRLRHGRGDLRGDLPSTSLPDEHEHIAGGYEHQPSSGPDIVHPGSDIQAPGQTSHQ